MSPRTSEHSNLAGMLLFIVLTLLLLLVLILARHRGPAVVIGRDFHSQDFDSEAGPAKLAFRPSVARTRQGVEPVCSTERVVQHIEHARGGDPALLTAREQREHDRDLLMGTSPARGHWERTCFRWPTPQLQRFIISMAAEQKALGKGILRSS